RFNPGLSSAIREQIQREFLRQIKDIAMGSVWLWGYQVPLKDCLEGLLKKSPELTELVIIDCAGVTHETLACLKQFKTLQKITLSGLPLVNRLQGPLSVLNEVRVQNCGEFKHIHCEEIKPLTGKSFLQLTLSASSYQP